MISPPAKAVFNCEDRSPANGGRVLPGGRESGGDGSWKLSLAGLIVAGADLVHIESAYLVREYLSIPQNPLPGQTNIPQYTGPSVQETPVPGQPLFP